MVQARDRELLDRACDRQRGDVVAHPARRGSPSRSREKDPKLRGSSMDSRRRASSLASALRVEDAVLTDSMKLICRPALDPEAVTAWASRSIEDHRGPMVAATAPDSVQASLNTFAARFDDVFVADVTSVLLWFPGKDLLAGMSDWLFSRAVPNPGSFRASLRDWIIANPAQVARLAAGVENINRCCKGVRAKATRALYTPVLCTQCGGNATTWCIAQRCVSPRGQATFVPECRVSDRATSNPRPDQAPSSIRNRCIVRSRVVWEKMA